MAAIIIALLFLIFIMLLMIWSKLSSNKTHIKFYEVKSKAVSSKGIPMDLKNLKRTTKKRSQRELNLESYLVSLVNGDRSIGARLVSSAQAKNPTQDREWCIQKAIDDILRDRN